MTNTDSTSLFDRLQRWDAQRPGIPGEHWLAFAAGVYLLARPRRSVATRLAAAVAGAGLIARALSGRDGALARLDGHARPDDDARYVDVAAPWPYDQRVRVAPPQGVRRDARRVGASTVPV